MSPAALVSEGEISQAVAADYRLWSPGNKIRMTESSACVYILKWLYTKKHTDKQGLYIKGSVGIQAPSTVNIA